MKKKRKKGIRDKWTKQIRLGKKKGVKEKTSYWSQRLVTLSKEDASIPPHFKAQPSKYVQKIESIHKPFKGKVGEYYVGMRLKEKFKYELLYDLVKEKDSKKWIVKNRKKITRQLVDALIDMNLKYGISHGNLSIDSIEIKKIGKNQPRILLGDFESSSTIREHTDIARDFKFVEKKILPEICDNAKQFKELKNYFRNYHEKRVKELA